MADIDERGGPEGSSGAREQLAADVSPNVESTAADPADPDSAAPEPAEHGDESIDAGVAVFLGVPLAIVTALVAMATIWLAAPWGPTTTEAGVVTEIDVDFTAGGQRMGGH